MQKLIELPISKLTSAPYNPRKISKSEFEKLKTSLKEDSEFFKLRPCMVNKRAGQLIVFAGNQRLKAAKALGWTKVPCLVVEVSLEQEKAWNLKDNNSAGEFDFKILATNFDRSILDRVGFKPTDLRRIEAEMRTATAINPEVGFTEELNEAHNYVVLYFNNDVDWLWFQSFIKLPTVKALDSKVGFEKKGVGRVLDGVKAIRAIQRQNGN